MSDAENKNRDRDQPPMMQSQSQSAPDDTSFAKKATPEKLLSGYKRSAGAFDELLAKDGEIFPHYAKLLGELEEFGAAELSRRADACQRFVHEHGITYNVYGDPRGMERPWQLDPIPFVIAPEEWRTLEIGLIQRATLLNKILADCYGAQELIRSRWLSPALVFGQPDFLRPCHGIKIPGDTFLHFYAADLSRSPDGRWFVVSDRTQISTGAGYALANRLVTSRILPEAFRDNHVHRVAGFFLAAQNSLAQLAPRSADRARVVMLTPGPHNETYFEQAYLARYLGYMLVEGQDLTVRDNHVFLKTLSGLERVDVILRRVDDDFCDPLELINNSILGVPSLVEAVRAGTVVMANALGSGLVQSPAFMSFLPGLCKHLLGEPLKLPSVATWWCGQTAAREHVLKNLDRLVVKPAFRTHLKIAEAEREELKKRIEFDPDLFVAQERVELSTALAWQKDSLTAQPVSLRVFLVADGKGGYCVMPGGLARVSPDSDGKFISMQRGGSSSKDTWIPSATPVEELTLLHGGNQNIELRRTGNNLPSRLADNFFWLGRYSERADATSRLLRSALLRFNPERAGGARPLLAPLLQTLEIQGQLPGISTKPELWANAEAFEAELLAAIFDPERAGSLRQTAEQLQRLAMLVRDRTSNDMWRVLSQIDDRLATPPPKQVMFAGDAVGVLNQTLMGLAAFHGLACENMTRAQAWRFLDMGLRLERAMYLCTLLDATLRSPEAENPSLLEAILEVVDSSITFRSRYNLLPTIPAVYDLVLLDDKNPRSVLFQIKQLVKHFDKLPKERGDTASPGKTILENCMARLERADARELASPSSNWQESALAATIREILRALPQLSDAIAASYFAHGARRNAMNYHITHRTLYEYAGPVSVSHHVARLEPRVTNTQSRESFSLQIFPEPTLRKARTDYFGNQLCFFAIQEIHSKLEIITSSRVTVSPKISSQNESTAPWESVAEMFRDPVSPEVVDAYQFVFDSPQVRASQELAEYARESFGKDTPLLAGARDLTRRIFEDFKFDPRATNVATPLEEVWQKRRGVCQDFAHFGIACLRSLGLPACYVSGYLRTRPPEGKPRLVGVDASHAWFRIFCPGTGWVDFDPTNNVQPAEEHMIVAYGRDFGDVSPVAGILTGGGAHEVRVSVDVEPLD